MTAEAPVVDPIAWDVDDFPWFPAYTAKWLLSKAVRLMTFEQRGIYWELLCIAWRDQGIPADLEDVATLIGCPLDVLERAWRRIGPLFEPKDGAPETRVNRWQEEIRDEQMAKKLRRRAASHVANAARHGLRTPSESETESDIDSAPNKEEEKEKERKGGKARKGAVTPTDAARSLYDGLTSDQRVKDVWDAILANFTMRQEKRFGQLAPTTLKLRGAEYRAIPVVQLVAALNHATMQGYQGVFPEKFAPKGDPALKVVIHGGLSQEEFNQKAQEDSERQLFG